MKQVDKKHYEFCCYMSKARWNSLWCQLDEVIRLRPKIVLEIGIGIGAFRCMADLFGIKIETLDIDLELNPSCVGSAIALPFIAGSFDVVCAFQMLEHLPYNQALLAFEEMARVSRGYIVISLPDARPVWRYQFYIPKLGTINLLLPRPFNKMKKHKFDGEHYWEINKNGYSLEKVLQDLSGNIVLYKTWRVFENPYHRFFLFKK